VDGEERRRNQNAERNGDVLVRQLRNNHTRSGVNPIIATGDLVSFRVAIGLNGVPFATAVTLVQSAAQAGDFSRGLTGNLVTD
jgi:hypothetical protein